MTCEYCYGEEYPGCVICCPEDYKDRSSRLHLMRHARSIKDYSIALQQAIEYAVRGELIPYVIVDQCPHHGHTLNSKTLRGEKTCTTPQEPTPAMIEAGAQRLLNWQDHSNYPDSWTPLQIRAARNDAERVWRSMWLAARLEGDEMKLRSPSEHAAYNATHYQGTRQICFLCDEEIERCEEDELYATDEYGYHNIGPLCLRCYSKETNK